jgi:hypothetical protein
MYTPPSSAKTSPMLIDLGQELENLAKTAKPLLIDPNLKRRRSSDRDPRRNGVDQLIVDSIESLN